MKDIKESEKPTASLRKCFLDQHKQGHWDTLQGVPNLPGTPASKFPGAPESSRGPSESAARYLQWSFWDPWYPVPASCRPQQPLSHCGGDSWVRIQSSGCQDSEVSLWPLWTTFPYTDWQRNSVHWTCFPKLCEELGNNPHDQLPPLSTKWWVCRELREAYQTHHHKGPEVQPGPRQKLKKFS